MKAIQNVKKEVDVKYVRLQVAVRYGEEDMPKDFPFRKNDMWCPTINVETGNIMCWPNGVEINLHMKVCDEGSYTLLDENNVAISVLENDYVPNGLIPGEYGDYIKLKIDKSGKITNWPHEGKISFSDFPGF